MKRGGGWERKKYINKFMFKLPKDDLKYQWTNHVKDKMVYYGISESLIKRIVRFPKRIEEGIAPKTTAVMQSGSNKKKPSEIWVMYQEIGQRPISGDKRQETSNKKFKNLSLGRLSLVSPRMRIISAWRYPGISPIGRKIPIPEEILQELGNII